MNLPKIGELRHRVRLLARSDHPAADNTVDSEYTFVDEVWAKIEPVGGALYQGGLQVDNKITHRIIIRLRGGVDVSSVFERKATPYAAATRYAVKRIADMLGAGVYLICEVEEIGYV